MGHAETGMQRSGILKDGTMGVSDAVEFTRLGRATLYRLMDDGKLPWVKIGTRRLIPRRALIELLSEGLSGGGEG